MGMTDGQIAAYCLMRIDQFSIDQNKMQREICWCHQRLTAANIPRQKYQGNSGRRAEETQERGPEVENWAAQNLNPFNIRNRQARQAERERQDVRVATGSSNDWVTSSGANTEDGERGVF